MDQPIRQTAICPGWHEVGGELMPISEARRQGWLGPAWKEAQAELDILLAALNTAVSERNDARNRQLAAIKMLRRLCDEFDLNPCETTENKVVIAEARALADELEAK